MYWTKTANICEMILKTELPDDHMHLQEQQLQKHWQSIKKKISTSVNKML